MKKESKKLLHQMNRIESSHVLRSSSYGSFILVISVGLLMALAVLGKMFLGFNIDSDWFWFLAGIGLAAEGVISFGRQKRVSKKYKILEKAEE